MESLFTCCIELSYLNSSHEKEQFSIDLIVSTLIKTLQEIWSRHSKECEEKAKEMSFTLISWVLRDMVIFVS